MRNKYGEKCGTADMAPQLCHPAGPKENKYFKEKQVMVMLFYKGFHDLCPISRSTKHFLSDI